MRTASEITGEREWPQDLAAIALHFNPCGYRAPRDNFRRFRREFHGCRLFTLEVSFDGEFQFDCDWQIQARDNQWIWQKEPAINWMVERLPAQYTKVAWIDADLLLLNSDWARQASDRLEHCPTLQLYTHIHYLNEAGELERTYASSVAALQGRSNKPGTCGGAWAARRELLTDHGMYPYSIVGGGDSCWLDGVRGVTDGKVMRRPTIALNAHFAKWQQRIFADVRGRVDCLPGDIVHLYHGTLVNRRYSERYQMLIDHHFDPELDVRVAENGLLEWASAKPELRQRMRNYFHERREDQPAGPVAKRGTVRAQGRLSAVGNVARGHNDERRVMGCYLVTRPDPQRGTVHPADDPGRVAAWALSLRQVGCQGCLLVDHLVPNITAAFPELEIMQVDAVPAWTHPNAWRWRLMAQVLAGKSWTRIFVTDVFDVQFRKDPFQLLSRRQCDLWIGSEEAIIGSRDRAAGWLAGRFRRTVGYQPPAVQGQRLLNAGILGGTATAVRKLADRMWQFLAERGADGAAASDMAALNFLVYEHYTPEQIWQRGAPLHSRFRQFEVERDDVCIVHK